LNELHITSTYNQLQSESNLNSSTVELNSNNVGGVSKTKWYDDETTNQDDHNMDMASEPLYQEEPCIPGIGNGRNGKQ